MVSWEWEINKNLAGLLATKKTPPPPKQVISYPLESMENATVSTLINARTRQWNEGLIDGIFAYEEATLFKKIPLG